MVLNNVLSFSWLIQTLLTRIHCQNVVILSFYAKNCLPKSAGEKSLSSVLLIALEFRIDETIRIVLLISNLCSFCTRNARFSQKIEISKSKFFIWLLMKKNPRNGIIYKQTIKMLRLWIYKWYHILNNILFYVLV